MRSVVHSSGCHNAAFKRQVVNRYPPKEIGALLENELKRCQSAFPFCLVEGWKVEGLLSIYVFRINVRPNFPLLRSAALGMKYTSSPDKPALKRERQSSRLYSGFLEVDLDILR